MTLAPTVACRACTAPIHFARTINRKSIPLDPVPSADGNITIGEVTVGGITVRDVAVVHARPELCDPDAPRYRSHFATCPEAYSFRKRKARR